jgi:hypothetical protein
VSPLSLCARCPVTLLHHCLHVHTSPCCHRAGRDVVRGLAEEYAACATDDYGSWDGGESGFGVAGEDDEDDAGKGAGAGAGEVARGDRR